MKFTNLGICVPLALLPAMAMSQSPTQKAAQSSNSFAFKLIGNTHVPSDSNYLISPFSATSALSLLLPGTQGAEQEKLLSLLSPGMNAQQSLVGYGSLSNQMMKGATVSIANSAWVDKAIKLNSPYAKSVKIGLGAQLNTFSHDSASVAKINGWVDTKTKHRIPKILDQIKPLDRLFLINAIAFDGKWKVPFDPKMTSSQDFHPLSSPPVQTPMMHMKHNTPYYKDAGVRAIRLDYEGDDYSMVLMLPEGSKDARALLTSMNENRLSAVMKGLASDSVEIALPKFKFANTFQLNHPLSAMGLASFFSRADFSKISASLKEARIDRVIQKTFIEVDEKGTKAAAATVIGIAAKAVRVDAPEFIADRPFAFFILHNSTKAILFAGVVNKP
jgi:serine protease inhibitor